MTKHLLQISAAFWSIIASHSTLFAQDEGSLSAQLGNAIWSRDSAVVLEILDRDATVIDQHIDGSTPLALSVKSNNPDIAELLLDAGADPNKRSADGDEIPILLAESRMMIDLLLAHEAEFDPAWLVDGKSPAIKARENQKYQAAKRFAELGAPLDFESAVKLGLIDEVTRMLEEKPWLAKPPTTSLYWVAGFNNVELARLLIDYGADPNLDIGFGNVTGPFTPLSQSVSCGRFEMTRFLLESGSDPNVAGGKADPNLFCFAIAFLDVGYMREMLRHDVDLRYGGDFHINASALRTAAALGGGKDFTRSKFFGQPRSLIDDELQAIEKVRALIDYGADVNERTFDGKTPLLFAALAENKEVCELLLAAGAKLDVYSACVLGRFDEVRKILLSDPNFDINKPGPLGLTLLHYVAKFGDSKLLDELIGQGADVNATAALIGYRDVDGFRKSTDKDITPLHLAVSSGDVEMMRLLVEAGADINAKSVSDTYGGRTTLERACFHGHVDAVEFLLEHDVIVNFEWNSPSPFMASHSVECFRMILKTMSPEQLDSELASKLIDASMNDAEIEKILFDHGAKLSFKQACALGRVDDVKTFLESDPTLATEVKESPRQNSPFEVAVWRNHLAVAKLLCEYNVKQSLTSEQQSNILGEAAEQGHLEIIKHLLSVGFDHAHLYSGGTLLHRAAIGAQSELVKYLIDDGYDVNAVDRSGDTPLAKAAAARFNTYEESPSQADRMLRTVEILIDAGANVNSSDSRGDTPLHVAAEHGRLQVVERLLQAGANVNSRNTRDETPITAAMDGRISSSHSRAQNDQQAVIELLVRHGGVE